jgi:SAM-dependent methyltransferase
MSNPSSDKLFAGPIPKIYETYLVPMLFEPYARDLASRLAAKSPARVLEIAAGTGVVTRMLASSLPEQATIVATDLNQPMLDQAAALGTSRPVEWRQADAMKLPFQDGEFDAVVCQFGVMFFPDKTAAFSEALRVLRLGGVLMFNTWDRLQENEFPLVVQESLASRFPGDPPRFMERIPHGYHDPALIRRDLAGAGFVKPADIFSVSATSRAGSPLHPAIAFCQGTPLRNEIVSRDPAGLDEATATAAEALARRFGNGPVEGRIQAYVVAIER